MKTSYGLFLPGGGLVPGENTIEGLRREIGEELGVSILDLQSFAQAAQYLYSRHYQQHFQKLAEFFMIRIDPAQPVQIEKDHELLWIPIHQAVEKASEEYQRWAITRFKDLSPRSGEAKD